MPAAKDISGARFGRLTVLRRNPEPHISPSDCRYTRWDCLCDCGREITVLRTALRPNASCGCARREKSAAHMSDLTGQRIGRWTVVSKAPLPRPAANGAKTGWLCRCDCGAEKVLSSGSLRSSRSCGCSVREASLRRINDDNVLGRYDGTVISAIRPDRPANKNSKTGVKGVFYSSRDGCYIAKIGFRGKSITIGRYPSIDLAAAARRAAEDEYYAPIIASAEGD